MKIGICLISTNKYQQFVQSLINDINKYFFINNQVEVHLFTDNLSPQYTSSDRVEIIKHPIPPYKYPLVTLYRYKIFNDHKEHLQNCSHLFYSDVDMAIVDFVGEEILPDESNEGLVATHHPGFYNGGWGSQNCNPLSKAFISKNLWKTYFAGGFQGGKTEDYLKVCKLLSDNITDDESRGIIAEYHDETHWNAYLSTRNPKILTPEYCMVEEIEKRKLWGINHFTPRIIALAKDHKKLRS